MARYLLIEFENDAQAETMKQMVDAQTEKGKEYRVVGLFARPRKFCECPRVIGYHQAPVVRGAKYGWNVCTVCKKVVMGSHNPINLIAAVDTKVMPSQASAYEYRVDNLGIFEVPTDNIKRDRTKELTDGG